jgi:hypothetical protein
VSEEVLRAGPLPFRDGIAIAFEPDISLSLLTSLSLITVIVISIMNQRQEKADRSIIHQTTDNRSSEK